MSVIQQELIHSIKEIAKEKKLSDDFVVDAAKDAIIKEYTREYVDSRVEVEFDLANNNFAVYRVYLIVANDLDENFDDYLEITLDDAKLFDPNAKIGGSIRKEVLLEKLDKKLIQNIWNSFKHNLNSEANKSIYKEWQHKKQTIGFFEVSQIDGSKTIVRIAKDVFGVLPYEEQIKGESLIVGKKYHFAIVDVLEHSKDWPIIVSRTDDSLFMYLLKKNVPEIEEGIIEVKKLARIPGIRSKIAVASTSSTSGIQPIGTIIGPGGSRINAIKQELDGERIDVIQYSADLKTFISNICFPVRIAGVRITDKMISIVCDDTPVQVRDKMVNNYMSLLGMRGNNISLIGKLLERPVELITPAVATEVEIEYEPIDYSNAGNRGPRNDNRPQSFTSHEKKRVDLGTEEFDELFSNE